MTKRKPAPPSGNLSRRAKVRMRAANTLAGLANAYGIDMAPPRQPSGNYDLAGKPPAYRSFSDALNKEGDTVMVNGRPHIFAGRGHVDGGGPEVILLIEDRPKPKRLSRRKRA